MTLDEELTRRAVIIAIGFFVEYLSEEDSHECYQEAFKEEYKKIEEEGLLVFNIQRFNDSYRGKLERKYLDNI